MIVMIAMVIKETLIENYNNHHPYHYNHNNNSDNNMNNNNYKTATTKINNNKTTITIVIVVYVTKTITKRKKTNDNNLQPPVISTPNEIVILTPSPIPTMKGRASHPNNTNERTKGTSCSESHLHRKVDRLKGGSRH